MTPEMEQKVLASLYDRLWDAITYSPGGSKTNVFDKQTSFVQFSKGEGCGRRISPMRPCPSTPAAT